MTAVINQTFEALAFTEILKQLEEYANSPMAKERIRALSPYLEEGELRRQMRDTTQARQMLDLLGNPPLPRMEQAEHLLEKAVLGELLLAEEMEEIGLFLTAVGRMQSYLERGREHRIPAAYYSDNLMPLTELREEIQRSIRGGRIDDHASGTLRDIRRELSVLEEKIKEKAESLLKSQKKYMTEGFVVTRNHRLCLPVKREYKSMIPGSVVDSSSTGATVFIEPQAVARLQDEYDTLKIEEDCEERKILYTLMDLIANEEEALKGNLDTLAKLDFIFAKGKLSAQMDAREPLVNTEGRICLRDARHPLLPPETNVPLQFEMGGESRGMIITGPNTGGKTVAIKTVGLFTLMAGCGLHLPCSYGDVAMRNQILCDIGDGQNMEDNLSTFSAHITNVLDILRRATGDSLVILDELGSGTDPAEGMGIAIAILEELRHRGCLYLVTTHYPEVKSYARRHGEIISARMAFDRENLKPLYGLEMGKSGDSCALYIAKRLGMPAHMLKVAAGEAYGQVKESLNKELDLEHPGGEELERIYVPGITPIKRKTESKDVSGVFSRGDSVSVESTGEPGIVVKPADVMGNVLVQVKGEKRMVNYKRLKLRVKASQLYPEDYDFSIIFDSVKTRKARHDMDRKYQKDLEIQVEDYKTGKQ